MPLSDSNLWKPAIYDGSSLIELPRPISSLVSNLSWDWRRSKVPLKDGITGDGPSQGGRDIEVQATVAINGDSGPLITEIAMYDRLIEIEDAMDVNGTDRLEFFIYHNASSAVYRKFTPCLPVDFSWEVGDQTTGVFRYTLKLHAEDPESKTTAPGS